LEENPSGAKDIVASGTQTIVAVECRLDRILARATCIRVLSFSWTHCRLEVRAFTLPGAVRPRLLSLGSDQF